MGRRESQRIASARRVRESNLFRIEPLGRDRASNAVWVLDKVPGQSLSGIVFTEKAPKELTPSNAIALHARAVAEGDGAGGDGALAALAARPVLSPATRAALLARRFAAARRGRSRRRQVRLHFFCLHFFCLLIYSFSLLILFTAALQAVRRVPPRRLRSLPHVLGQAQIRRPRQPQALVPVQAVHG